MLDNANGRSGGTHQGRWEDDAMEEQSNADLRIHSEVTRIWGEWVGMDPT